ncbi:alpha/beta hydrolase, partial [Streptomyces sp. NRRL WC-3753]
GRSMHGGRAGGPERGGGKRVALEGTARGITTPCLVVGFADDLILPAHLGREVADAIPGARYVEVADAGHYGYLERPDQVNNALLDFFAQRA